MTEFVEERVRQFPTEVFDPAGLKRALATALEEGGAGFHLAPGGDRALIGMLDQHPFLVRARDGPPWRGSRDCAKPEGNEGGNGVVVLLWM